MLYKDFYLQPWILQDSIFRKKSDINYLCRDEENILSFRFSDNKEKFSSKNKYLN